MERYIIQASNTKNEQISQRSYLLTIDVTCVLIITRINLINVLLRYHLTNMFIDISKIYTCIWRNFQFMYFWRKLVTLLSKKATRFNSKLKFLLAYKKRWEMAKKGNQKGKFSKIARKLFKS